MLMPSSSATSFLVLPGSTKAKTWSALARAVGMPPRYLPSVPNAEAGAIKAYLESVVLPMVIIGPDGTDGYHRSRRDPSTCRYGLKCCHCRTAAFNSHCKTQHRSRQERGSALRGSCSSFYA